MNAQRGMFAGIAAGSPPHKWYKNFAQTFKFAQSEEELAKNTELRLPKAIVVITAHWETSRQTIGVSDDEQHSLYYDYYGFPESTYNLDYAPRGDREIAKYLVQHLRKSNIKAETVSGRGLDHGVFIPMMTAFPKATNIPIIQMSIDSKMDPAFHFQYGRALRSLREEGFLFIASGQATHDLQGRLQTADGSALARFAFALIFLWAQRSKGSGICRCADRCRVQDRLRATASAGEVARHALRQGLPSTRGASGPTVCRCRPRFGRPASQDPRRRFLGHGASSVYDVVRVRLSATLFVVAVAIAILFRHETADDTRVKHRLRVHPMVILVE